jgi:hypothetical protein
MEDDLCAQAAYSARIRERLIRISEFPSDQGVRGLGDSDALTMIGVGVGDPGSGVRLAELVGAFSLATDLGMGQPMEHVLRSWLIAVRLGGAWAWGPRSGWRFIT